MSIARVQGNQVNSSSSVTSQTITLPSGITLGNLVVACVATGNNATTFTGPSGWTQAVVNMPAGDSATIETSIWYMVVSAGHAGETSWTWTLSASHTAYICISEWSSSTGWQASPLDVTAQGDTAGSPTASTTIQSGTTATTAQASELWIASLAYKNSSQSESGVTAGWTSDLESTLAANNTMTMLYNIASSTGTASCQYTIGSAQFWAGCIATFMPASGGGGGSSLTLYGSNVSDANLPSASSMSTVTGGTETSATTTVTGTNPYAEIYSRSATEASVTSAPAPSGKGWVYQPGAGTFSAANWSASITLSATNPGTTDATLLVYKYNGSYTSIGSINKTGIVGAKTTYSFVPTSMSSFSTTSTDLVYFYLVWHDTNGADDAPTVYVSNSATAGVVGDMQITTAPFTPSSSTTPALSTSPTTLSFSATVGGGNPASKNTTLSETAGASTAWTSNISYGSGSGWLAISPSSGSLAANGSQTVSFTCTTGALAAGTYTATVTFTATTGGATATVGVTFTVSAPSSPVLATSPNTLSFSAVEGGTNPPSQSSTLSETAGIATAWTANISYGSGSGWLAISPSSGSLGASGTQSITFSCTTGALAVGTYSATVTFTATTGGNTATVSVTFTVSAPGLAASPSSLSFSAVEDGANPASQSSTLSETAGGATAWTSGISYGSGSGWLAISPSLGSLGAHGSQTISFACTTGILAAGTYNATVTFTATSGGATATVSVTFTIGANVRILSGGFGLFANTASGTVSFDHFRATSYPDPSLSLAPVLPRLGSSNVAYNASVPPNTILTVKTSTDGVNWSAATSGAPIPGLSGQPDPVIDLFDADSGANYTSIGAGSWTYETANSRIIGSGTGLYLYTAITAADVDLIADMDRSDAGGPVWRFIDTNNYYMLDCYDDSASGGFTSQLRLYKVAGGTLTLLGSAAVVWARSTVGASPYKRIRTTMFGDTITAYFDGEALIAYTDSSPLGAGQCGLHNDSGTSRYYQLRIQEQGDYVSGIPEGDVVTAGFVYTQIGMSTSDPAATPQLLDLMTAARSPQIATGALIPQLHDPSKPFSEYFNKELDTLAQASGDFYWTVGPDAYGHLASLTFAPRHGTPAPWILHSTDLKFSPTGPQTSIVTPTFANDLYRNRQTITNTISLVTVDHEQKIADGTATSWTMAYPLYSAPIIVVQGIPKTVGVQGVDSGRDFYWQSGSASISQDTSATKLPAGYLIDVSYVGQFPDKVTRDNLPEQAARALIEAGTSGIVEAWEDGQGMLSTNAIVYADGLLARFSRNDAVELVTTTTRSGLTKGMLVPAFLPEHHLHNRQLLMVKLLTTAEQDSTGNVLYYFNLDMTDGPNLNNWTNAIFG